MSLDPVQFTADGCIALSATAGDRRRTVFLDAGHGDPDPGARGVLTSGRAVEEKDLTLPVALEAGEQLRARGYRVVLSRTADGVGARLTPGDLSRGSLSTDGVRAQLAARVRCANLARAGALVSIHLNSFGDREVRGAETIYEPDRPFAAANRRLAALLQREILEAHRTAGQPTSDRGLLAGAAPDDDSSTSGGEDLVLLGPAAPGRTDEPTATPGAVVEPLFITNPAEATRAADPAGRRALVAGIASAVEEFLQQP